MRTQIRFNEEKKFFFVFISFKTKNNCWIHSSDAVIYIFSILEDVVEKYDNFGNNWWTKDKEITIITLSEKKWFGSKLLKIPCKSHIDTDEGISFDIINKW